MKLIDVSAVKIPKNRQRKEFRPAELAELGESIRSKGLLQPIVLRVEDEEYVLVSGERRLRAIRDLYMLEETFLHDGEPVRAGGIPYTLFSDLDPLSAEEAEADENLKRADLTWQEKADWTLRFEQIKRIRAEQAGEPPPSITDITRELDPSASEGRTDRQLGRFRDDIRKELVVARNLHNPLVKGAKNVDEAFKILKKEEATEKHRALGEKVGRTFTADVHRAINTDCLEWLRSCPAETYDVILTDPPYGMGADNFGDSGGRAEGAHGYSDSSENYRKVMDVFTTHSFRVARPSSHIYIFCDFENALDLRLELTEAGWNMFRTPLIWYKKNGSRAPWPDAGPQRKYELILFGVKGKRPVNHMKGDVLEYAADENLGHAAQKPVALFEDLLRRSVRPGDSVLDPFAGSGTIFPAANSLKCRATGIEVDGSFYGVAVKRIEQLKKETIL